MFHRLSGSECDLLVPTFSLPYSITRQSQWPSGLRRGTVAARMLGLPVRMLVGAWKFVSCECCMLSDVFAMGRSLVQRGPTKYECVIVCDHVQQ